jgi:hypothetical protein
MVTVGDDEAVGIHHSVLDSGLLYITECSCQYVVSWLSDAFSACYSEGTW